MKGFTPKESAVIAFLCLGFIGGLTVKSVREHHSPLAEATGPERVSVTQTADTSHNFNPARLAPRRIDINRADRSTLERLPGIGPVMAQRIIDFREQHGPFQHVEMLKSVRGIGVKSLETLRPHITINNLREK